MRLYEVQFAHVEHGSNWCATSVCVDGYADAAIKRAFALEPKDDRRDLRVEQVLLKGEGE